MWHRAGTKCTYIFRIVSISNDVETAAVTISTCLTNISILIFMAYLTSTWWRTSATFCTQFILELNYISCYPGYKCDIWLRRRFESLIIIKIQSHFIILRYIFYITFNIYQIFGWYFCRCVVFFLFVNV